MLFAIFLETDTKSLMKRNNNQISHTFGPIDLEILEKDNQSLLEKRNNHQISHTFGPIDLDILEKANQESMEKRNNQITHTFGPIDLESLPSSLHSLSLSTDENDRQNSNHLFLKSSILCLCE